MRKYRAIYQQDAETEQHGEKESVIGAPDAVHHPDAVVVVLGDADVADAAVFAARGFGEVAGGAEEAGVEENAVVGVLAEGVGVVARGYCGGGGGYG